MIWIQEPEVGSQSRMALSHPELASRLPSGLHPTPDTLQRWPRNTLGLLGPLAQPIQQCAQLPLHLSSSLVDALQARQQRSQQQPLLRLPHVFLGSRLREAMLTD